MSVQEELISQLEDVDLVVQDTNKFKIKLGIGEDAYSSLTLKKNLTTLWELKGAAASGAALASSSAVASTLFAGTAGPLAALGIGAAAVTPVGWVIGAAILSSSAYYGASQLVSNYNSSRVESIPKFINTPIDMLGATLFDMMAGLALKISSLSHPIEASERAAVCDYFIEEWGISPEYAQKATPLIELSLAEVRLKDMAKSMVEFQLNNPDCNPTAMSKDITNLLEEIAYADGDCDEVEELAIEAVQSIISGELASHKQIINSASKYAQKTTDAAIGVADQAGKTATAALEGASKAIGQFWKSK